MDEKLAIVLSYIQSGSVFMPFMFIAFHVLRQLLFIPVIVVCISGGILFGPVLGTIYSIIGLTLSNLCFYFIIGKFPKTRDKLLLLKDKLFGNRGTVPSSILKEVQCLAYRGTPVNEGLHLIQIFGTGLAKISRVPILQ